MEVGKKETVDVKNSLKDKKVGTEAPPPRIMTEKKDQTSPAQNEEKKKISKLQTSDKQFTVDNKKDSPISQTVPDKVEKQPSSQVHIEKQGGITQPSNKSETRDMKNTFPIKKADIL